MAGAGAGPFGNIREGEVVATPCGRLDGEQKGYAPACGLKDSGYVLLASVSRGGGDEQSDVPNRCPRAADKPASQGGHVEWDKILKGGHDVGENE